MTLPDWSSAIMSSVSDFLSWGAIANTVPWLIGISIGTLALSMLMSALLRR